MTTGPHPAWLRWPARPGRRAAAWVRLAGGGLVLALAAWASGWTAARGWGGSAAWLAPLLAALGAEVLARGLRPGAWVEDGLLIDLDGRWRQPAGPAAGRWSLILDLGAWLLLRVERDDPDAPRRCHWLGVRPQPGDGAALRRRLHRQA